MHTTSIRFSRLVLIVAVGGLTSCAQEAALQVQPPSDPWGVVHIQAADPIRIGLIVSVGDQMLGQESVEMERGAQLAVDEFGSIIGKEVDLVVVHSECSVDGGASAAQQFAADVTLAGIVGPPCQNACLGAADVLAPAHLTAISGTCGPDEMFQTVNDGGLFFRTMYSDSVEGELAAQFAFSELAARRAVIVQYPPKESENFATGFQTRLEALGGLVVDSVEVQPGTREFRVVLATISGLRPDVIYVALLPADAAEFIASKGDSFMANTPLVATRYAWSSWFAAQVDSSGVGTYATGPNLDNGKYEAISTTYINRYGSEPSSSLFAYTYDAVHLMLESIRQVGVLTSAGEYYFGRRSVNEAIRNTAALDGVTGELTCTPWGDCGVASIAVGRLNDDGWSTIFVP